MGPDTPRDLGFYGDPKRLRKHAAEWDRWAEAAEKDGDSGDAARCRVAAMEYRKIARHIELDVPPSRKEKE